MRQHEAELQLVVERARVGRHCNVVAVRREGQVVAHVVDGLAVPQGVRLQPGKGASGDGLVGADDARRRRHEAAHETARRIDGMCLIQHEVAERARREGDDGARVIADRRQVVRRVGEPFAPLKRQRQQRHHVLCNALIERGDLSRCGHGRHPPLRRQQLDACRPAGGFDAPQPHAGCTPSSLARIVVSDFRLSELENSYDVLHSSAFFFEERKHHDNDQEINDGRNRRGSGARAVGRRSFAEPLRRHVEGEGHRPARTSRSCWPRTAPPPPIAAAKA